MSFNSGVIAACITGNNDNSAVKIIRISGFSSLDQLSPLLSEKCLTLEPRQATLCPLFVHNKQVDNVLVTFFKGKKSYSGENTIEVACHGNRRLVQSILDYIVENSIARLARSGEFTYRALRNGKLSLSQIEGLELFLNGSSPLALEHGFSLLQGELSKKYFSLRDSFIKLKQCVELLIDFSDDIGDQHGLALLKHNFDIFSNILYSIYGQTLDDNSLLLNPKVVLLGDTNAGKSSLFNTLLMQDRAIVSSAHGTTRDFVTDFLSLDGISFSLVDTAGLRTEADDSVEKIGIERTVAQVDSAFFVINVINPLNPNSQIVDTADFVVFTHADFPESKKRVDNLMSESYKPWLHVQCGPIGPTHNGPIGPLHSSILNKYREAQAANPVCVARHREIFSALLGTTNALKSLILEESDLAIIDHHLNMIGNSIEELVGIISPDEVLASIFKNFCIGK